MICIKRDEPVAYQNCTLTAYSIYETDTDDLSAEAIAEAEVRNSFDLHTCSLTHMEVLPEYRGHGIASLLLQQILHDHEDRRFYITLYNSEVGDDFPGPSVDEIEDALLRRGFAKVTHGQSNTRMFERSATESAECNVPIEQESLW